MKQVKRNEGKDEMNLATFPLTALTKEKCMKPIKINYTKKIQGKLVKCKWTVDGSLTYGIPNAIDNDVLLSFFCLAKQQGCFEPGGSDEVHYTYGELFKILGWNRQGNYYDAHNMSLIRLLGASVIAEHTFYDNKKRCLVPMLKGFHIIEDFSIYGKKTGNSDIDSHLWDMSFNSVRFSKVILESARHGFIKFIDLNEYFSFKRPLTKRLYRFLDKELYKRKSVHYGIKDLCFNHLGMSTGYNLAQLKRELDKAHKELEPWEYLADWYYYDYKSGEEEKNESGKRVMYVKGVSSIKTVRQQSTELACIVRKNFFGDNPPSPSIREIENVERLIKQYGYEKSAIIMDLVQLEASASKLKPDYIGYLLTTYKNKVIKQLENQEKQKQIQTQQEAAHKQEEAQREQEKQEQAELKKYYFSLSQSEQKKIDQKSEEIWQEKYGGYDSKMSRELALLDAIQQYKQEAENNGRP
ncbi:MAG TPA: hypothetical protein DCX95_03045 [Elusimicrobia bacterium]|nr:hypothetical protein [Elusimicrobiota bacterium]